RNGDNAAFDYLAFNLLKHTSRYVFLMPAGIHEDAFCPRLETRREVIDVPLPALLSYGFRISVLATSEEIIAQTQVSPKARDTDASANAVIFAPASKAPAGCCVALRWDPIPQVLATNPITVPNPPPPPSPNSTPLQA